MWRDAEGVIHTIASPRPEDIAGAAIAEAIRHAASEDLNSLEAAMEDLEQDFYDEAEGNPGELGIPDALPDGPVVDDTDIALAGIAHRVSAVGLVWRLELIESIRDLIDERD